MEKMYNMTDYEKTYAEFKWEVPEYFNFSRDIIDKWAEDPEKLAMVCIDDNGNELKKTFKDLRDTSKRLASFLTKEGIRRGDVVVVILGREPEWWEILTACIRMGAIVTPGTTQLTSKDLEYRINTAEAACFITNEVIAPKLEEIWKSCPTLRTNILKSLHNFRLNI
ncbi:MAG: AMP-binding protein [Deltaproteobacteria bacterium]|nr:AMP-binding protein [Deltaproteobacteria bacterium]